MRWGRGVVHEHRSLVHGWVGGIIATVIGLRGRAIAVVSVRIRIAFWRSVAMDRWRRVVSVHRSVSLSVSWIFRSALMLHENL